MRERGRGGEGGERERRGRGGVERGERRRERERGERDGESDRERDAEIEGVRVGNGKKGRERLRHVLLMHAEEPHSLRGGREGEREKKQIHRERTRENE
jgi:hypothetical protein